MRTTYRCGPQGRLAYFASINLFARMATKELKCKVDRLTEELFHQKVQPVHCRVLIMAKSELTQKISIDSGHMRRHDDMLQTQNARNTAREKTLPYRIPNALDVTAYDVRC